MGVNIGYLGKKLERGVRQITPRKLVILLALCQEYREENDTFG